MPDKPPQILFVSYYFPPFWSTGTVRIAKMTKFLSRQGHRVTVITPRRLFMDRTSRTRENYDRYADVRRIWIALPDLYIGLLRFLENIVRFFKRKKIPPSPLPVTKTGSSKHSFETVYRPGLRKRLERFFMPIDFFVLWLPFACLYASVYVSRHPSIEAVWISGPPYSQLLVGVWLKKLFPKLRFAADFRDHWTEDMNLYCPTQWHRRIEHWAENTILQKADHLIFISEIHYERCLEKGPYEQKAVIIYNGVDPEDFRPRSPASRFDTCTLDYFGNIGEARNIGYFIDAVAQLIDEGRLPRKGFNVRFYGTVPAYFHQQINAYGLNSVIQILARMPYAEALDAMQRSYALLLVIDVDPYTSCYPAKFFEYLYAARPIFVLGQDRGAGRYVKDKKIGWVAPEQETEEIKKRLIELYDTYVQGTMNDFKVDAIPFQRETQARELIQVLLPFEKCAAS